MTKTDIRDRLFVLARALGADPSDARTARVIERAVRDLDEAMTAAHVDGRELEREVGASP